MAGALATNFRGANLAEDLGLFLLRQICAVAECRRQDDIGVDAIATLLRPDGPKRMIAEDSFFVQIKSASIKSVDYKGADLEWLLKQPMPFFLAQVCLNNQSISITPAIDASQSFLLNGIKHVRFCFNGDFPSREHKWLRFHIVPNDIVEIVCYPIVRFSLHEISNKFVLENTYLTLKSIIKAARSEMELNSLGQARQIEWKTNSPEIEIKPFGHFGPKIELQALTDKLGPIIESIMRNALTLPISERQKIMASAADLMSSLRDAGLEGKDPNIYEFFKFVADNFESDQ